jgi:CRP/FNR family cyclic AMP-dependent transcriptional regulator
MFVVGSFLARLDDGEQAALKALGAQRSFPRSAVLMFEQELEERVMLLLKGRVKVTHVTHDGRELLLNIRDPGDVLGELALVDREPRAATVVAIEPVLALVLSGAAFRSYLEATPRVAVVLLEIVVARFREEFNRRLQFTESDTMGRLAARLVELTDRYGEQTAEGISVALPFSQEELASWTGASRAGVAQALQALRELGWIRTERRTLLVTDASALRSRAA